MNEVLMLLAKQTQLNFGKECGVPKIVGLYIGLTGFDDTPFRVRSR